MGPPLLSWRYHGQLPGATTLQWTWPTPPRPFGSRALAPVFDVHRAIISSPFRIFGRGWKRQYHLQQISSCLLEWMWPPSCTQIYLACRGLLLVPSNWKVVPLAGTLESESIAYMFNLCENGAAFSAPLHRHRARLCSPGPGPRPSLSGRRRRGKEIS